MDYITWVKGIILQGVQLQQVQCTWYWQYEPAIEICKKDNIDVRKTSWMKEVNTIFPYGLKNDGKEDVLPRMHTMLILVTPPTSVFTAILTRQELPRTKEDGHQPDNTVSSKGSPLGSPNLSSDISKLYS